MAAGAEESEADIVDYVASNVAHYKKVRLVNFAETIPKSPSGKIMRRLVKDQMIQKMQASSKANPKLSK